MFSIFTYIMSRVTHSEPGLPMISSLTSMKKLKNSLELPNPTTNTRKFANKLMNDTSGEINLQSKQDIICHEAKKKPTTSAHSVADVVPFLAYIKFPSNPTLR